MPELQSMIVELRKAHTNEEASYDIAVADLVDV
jgi:hypothetical protein